MNEIVLSLFPEEPGPQVLLLRLGFGTSHHKQPINKPGWKENHHGKPDPQ